MKDRWWSGQTRFGVHPGLERIDALLERLHHPERAYPIIHVAGTNGKGSVAAMLTEALMSQGLTVGLTTSPDLGRINERVMINRKPLDERVWDELAEHIEKAGLGLENMPTWFETIIALAFLAFREQPVDIAVVEVGLGGRLDATNVIPPAFLSVITPIARDHMHILGDSVSRIAEEKAGIIKPGTEVILSRQPFPEARQVVLRRAEALEVPIYEPKIQAQLGSDGPYLPVSSDLVVTSGLKGAYQMVNLETAWTAIERLLARGLIHDLPRAQWALSTVNWPGRFEVVSQHPLMVVDGAHNPHGMEGVVMTLRQPPFNAHRWDLVFGVFKDKAHQEMLHKLLPYVHQITLTAVPGERGLNPNALYPAIEAWHRPKVIWDPLAAVQSALERLPADGSLLVTGSLALLTALRQRGWYHPGQLRLHSI